MPDYKVNFKELKARVGVTDVAYALGYRLDRKAGVGRYIELVLGDGREKRDTIIVSHPNDRSAQTFFRRDGSKGDVLTLIRENLDAFPRHRQGRLAEGGQGHGTLRQHARTGIP